MCGKRFPNICIGLDLFWCFRIEEIRDNDNATGLKEGGEIEIEKSTVAFHIRDCTRSLLRLNVLLTLHVFGGRCTVQSVAVVFVGTSQCTGRGRWTQGRTGQA